MKNQPKECSASTLIYEISIHPASVRLQCQLDILVGQEVVGGATACSTHNFLCSETRLTGATTTVSKHNEVDIKTNFLLFLLHLHKLVHLLTHTRSHLPTHTLTLTLTQVPDLSEYPILFSLSLTPPIVDCTTPPSLATLTSCLSTGLALMNKVQNPV